MLRTIMAVVFLILLAVMVLAGGRGNIVRHYYDDGTYKEFWASQGSCRHHLSAHPHDQIAKVNGFVFAGPDACN